jgi:hypothetical protein
MLDLANPRHGRLGFVFYPILVLSIWILPTDTLTVSQVECIASVLAHELYDLRLLMPGNRDFLNSSVDR